MSVRDYYEVLGVERTADESALKGAYRKLAMKYHPDRNPGDKDAEAKFREAAEAYGVLSDAQKRATYDRYGHQGLNNSGGAGGGFDPGAFNDFEDILGAFGFGDLFGMGGGRQRGGSRGPARGEDIRHDLTISLEEAVKGTQAEIQVPRHDPCTRCNGTAAEPNDGLVTCPMCKGRGEVLYQQSFLSIRRTCGQCNGRGQLIRRPCVQCKGEGMLRSERKLKVTVPPGVDTGIRLKQTGAGHPGPNGARAGDLYVVMHVEEHPVFKRHENDLHCLIPINVAQAALGAEVDLLTFDGLERVKIPEGTQSGEVVRLRGKGVPSLQGGGRGEIIVHIEVRTPRKLSRDQRKLFEQLRDVLPVENEPQEKGLLDRVKEFFL